ncbi:MAG: phosphoenolpyruvate carboxylase [Alphaproteobacteria bacterium]|nr:phosphoenolpyruvate carboxylase [Alphaproteobacteria bacterium]
MPTSSLPLNDEKLKSTKAIEVAIELSNRWLEQIGDSDLVTRLKRIRAAAWNLNGDEVLSGEVNPEAKRQAFEAALEGSTSEKKTALLESYARLGHIYEIAGLVARENYFQHCRTKEEPIPAGVNDFLGKEDEKNEALGAKKLSPDKLLAKIMKDIETPVFEVVMTQHPTNVNSLEFMQAQRALAIEIEKYNKGKNADIDGKLKAFQEAKIINEKDGQPQNLTVRKEIDTVINTLNNIYDDVPRVFAQYDHQLEKREGYKPEDLKLNIRLGSWGSAGDKDGNKSITAFHTLEGIALHTQAILTHYKDDLAEIKAPELSDWKKNIEEKFEAVKEITSNIVALRAEQEQLMKDKYIRGFDSKTLNQKFDQYSRQLAEARKSLKKEDFEQALQIVYAATGGEEKQKTLELLRRVRTFGFTFAKIEYRETAKEYARVVDNVLGDNYLKKTPQQKVGALTKNLMLDGGTADLGHEFAPKLTDILATGAGNSYDDDNALAISYNTLKRMQLAREHDDMIKDNVLAECGKCDGDADKETVAAQGVANLLEAQFLQRVVQDKEKGKPVLGIVPLFEEPETMKNIKEIMEMAYTNEAYAQHMKAASKKHHPTNNGKSFELTQQVQIAHSDNARRSGLLAARGLIHQAHERIRRLNNSEQIRKLNGGEPIKTEFFEGGSISDAYRNGARCPSAIVDAFQMHDFAKFTFQGGDLLNYFNVPCASERLFSRNLAEQSRGLAKIKSNGKEENNKLIDKVAIRALAATLGEYAKNDFIQEKMGMLLELLDYNEETKAGNSTSRAAARSGPVFGKVVINQKGAEVTVEEKKLKGIEIDGVRTIAYSESSQHAGLVLSWIGSDELLNHIGEQIVAQKGKIKKKAEGLRTQEEKAFIEAFGSVEEIPGVEKGSGKVQYTITADHLQNLYKFSPAFHDAQDRAAFAIAMTNMDRVEKTVDTNMKKYLDEVGNNRQNKEGVKKYLGHLTKVLKHASWVAAASRGEKQLGKYDDSDSISNKEASDMVARRLELMSEEIAHKRGYRSFGIHVKQQETEGGKDMDDYLRRVVHNAVDTVVHGRWLVGDLKAAKAIHQHHKDEAEIVLAAQTV